MSRFYYIDLYDLYSGLLTERQQQYFEDYYYDNLTLSEMSENYGISRNAIHKQVKESLNKLEKLESILKLYEKNKRIKEICENLDEEIKSQILELL